MQRERPPFTISFQSLPSLELAAPSSSSSRADSLAFASFVLQQTPVRNVLLLLHVPLHRLLQLLHFVKTAGGEDGWTWVGKWKE